MAKARQPMENNKRRRVRTQIYSCTELLDAAFPTVQNVDKYL
jgi:hypothetical protein